jgi:hypothetical protein
MKERIHKLYFSKDCRDLQVNTTRYVHWNTFNKFRRSPLLFTCVSVSTFPCLVFNSFALLRIFQPTGLMDGRCKAQYPVPLISLMKQNGDDITTWQSSSAGSSRDRWRQRKSVCLSVCPSRSDLVSLRDQFSWANGWNRRHDVSL